MNLKPLPTRYAISPLQNINLWDRLMANRIKEHLERYKNAMREAEEASSRVLQMHLADKLGIRWFVV